MSKLSAGRPSQGWTENARSGLIEGRWKENKGDKSGNSRQLNKPSRGSSDWSIKSLAHSSNSLRAENGTFCCV